MFLMYICICISLTWYRLCLVCVCLCFDLCVNGVRCICTCMCIIMLSAQHCEAYSECVCDCMHVLFTCSHGSGIKAVCPRSPLRSREPGKGRVKSQARAGWGI